MEEGEKQKRLLKLFHNVSKEEEERERGEKGRKSGGSNSLPVFEPDPKLESRPTCHRVVCWSWKGQLPEDKFAHSSPGSTDFSYDFSVLQGREG